jgi:hypothetical protein
MNRNPFTGQPSKSDYYVTTTSTAAGTIKVQVKDIVGDNADGKFVLTFFHAGDSTATAATIPQVFDSVGATAAFSRDTATDSYVFEVRTKYVGLLETDYEGAGSIVGTADEWVSIVSPNGEKVLQQFA